MECCKKLTEKCRQMSMMIIIIMKVSAGKETSHCVEYMSTHKIKLINHEKKLL